MTRARICELVHRLIDAASRRDLAALGDCYAEDALVHSPVFGDVRGRPGIIESWRTLFATFADLSVEVSTILVDHDRVAVLSAIKTKDRAGWFGRRATGAPIGYRLVLLLTVANGRIADDERIYDSAGVVERLEKARIDKELHTAAEVQRALAPRAEVQGAFFRYVGDSLPCRAIGGDFFDVIRLDSGALAVVIGDVAGKGPAAALLAALLQGMFEADASRYGPAAMLQRMNDRLVARGLDAKFATAFCAVLSADGRLTYSNAGHNPPALLSTVSRRLTEGGPILGAFGDTRFCDATVTLDPGDIVVLFTDGATEAMNPSGEELGEARLVGWAAAARVDPQDMVSGLFAQIRKFCGDAEQLDDVTLNVLRFR